MAFETIYFISELNKTYNKYNAFLAQGFLHIKMRNGKAGSNFSFAYKSVFFVELASTLSRLEPYPCNPIGRGVIDQIMQDGTANPAFLERRQNCHITYARRIILFKVNSANTQDFVIFIQRHAMVCVLILFIG